MTNRRRIRSVRGSGRKSRRDRPAGGIDCFSSLKKNPLYLIMLPVWLLRGRSYLKHEIARRVKFNAANLPYHAGVLSWLREERRRGRRIILATASDRVLASCVADHLGLFAAVHASDGRTNLKGPAKLAFLADRYGSRGFAYVGNSRRRPFDLAAGRLGDHRRRQRCACRASGCQHAGSASLRLGLDSFRASAVAGHATPSVGEESVAFRPACYRAPVGQHDGIGRGGPRLCSDVSRIGGNLYRERSARSGIRSGTCDQARCAHLRAGSRRSGPACCWLRRSLSPRW